MWWILLIIAYSVILSLLILLSVKEQKVLKKEQPKQQKEQTFHPLTCFVSPYPKYRMGKDFDGGYIVCHIPNIEYGCLISGGICDDISFEEDFSSKFPNSQCYTYDGTIEGIHTKNKRIHFTKKNIGSVNTNEITNLHKLLENQKNIFVKMDIEGGEVEWINSLHDKHFDSIVQMVIEFHHPFGKEEVKMFNKINKHFVLVHIHGNNCCPTQVHHGVVTPQVFECTYIHKRFVRKPYQLNTEPLPSPLDMMNVVSSGHDIDLNYPPFVN